MGVRRKNNLSSVFDGIYFQFGLAVHEEGQASFLEIRCRMNRSELFTEFLAVLRPEVRKAAGVKALPDAPGQLDTVDGLLAHLGVREGDVHDDDLS